MDPCFVKSHRSPSRSGTGTVQDSPCLLPSAASSCARCCALAAHDFDFDVCWAGMYASRTTGARAVAVSANHLRTRSTARLPDGLARLLDTTAEEQSAMHITTFGRDAAKPRRVERPSALPSHSAAHAFGASAMNPEHTSAKGPILSTRTAP